MRPETVERLDITALQVGLHAFRVGEQTRQLLARAAAIHRLDQGAARIRDELAAFDAEKKFAVAAIAPEEAAVCISGEILQGLKKPPECPAFGRECTPANPLGATMVSSEGACAAYHKYSRKGLL